MLTLNSWIISKFSTEKAMVRKNISQDKNHDSSKDKTSEIKVDDWVS